MPFKKGQSGNPAGRPKGLRDRRAALRYKLTRQLPDILKTLAAAAKAGDIPAAKLILERTLPALKTAAETLTLPAPETLAGQGRVVMEAVASGDISPDEALKLMQAVGAQLRIVEAEEMAKRIEALEQALSRRQR
jgi:dihydrodipicolinate synthase/N-acetylneuraminate lyase